MKTEVWIIQYAADGKVCTRWKVTDPIALDVRSKPLGEDYDNMIKHTIVLSHIGCVPTTESKVKSVASGLMSSTDEVLNTAEDAWEKPDMTALASSFTRSLDTIHRALVKPRDSESPLAVLDPTRDALIAQTKTEDRKSQAEEPKPEGSDPKPMSRYSFAKPGDPSWSPSLSPTLSPTLSPLSLSPSLSSFDLRLESGEFDFTISPSSWDWLNNHQRKSASMSTQMKPMVSDPIVEKPQPSWTYDYSKGKAALFKDVFLR